MEKCQNIDILKCILSIPYMNISINHIISESISKVLCICVVTQLFRRLGVRHHTGKFYEPKANIFCEKLKKKTVKEIKFVMLLELLQTEIVYTVYAYTNIQMHNNIALIV